MNRGTLIVGNDCAQIKAIEKEAAGRAENYALALIQNRFSGAETSALPQVTSGQTQPEKGRFLLDWNPGSPISARTLVIAAETRLGHIDEAILVCDPPIVRSTGAGGSGVCDLAPADVEILVNDHIKSWYFLLKELAVYFRACKKGMLVLVYPEINPKDVETDILGNTALAAFRSLTGNFLSAASGEPFVSTGFSGIAAGDEAGFASFIFKQIEEGSRRNNGKLQKYGKLGFFR